jgi:hypothetical protein
MWPSSRTESPPAILLRESYCEAGKTKNRTLANLSGWPADRIEQLRAVLRGDQLPPAAEAVEMSARCRMAMAGRARHRAPHRARHRAAAPRAATPPAIWRWP